MVEYKITRSGGHKALDLRGKKFNRLTVIERAENAKSGNARWRCLCDCGNYTTVESYKLRKELTKSCGCLISETSKKSQSLNNQYKILGDTVEVIDNQGNSFIVDLDKLDLVKKYYWSVNPRGYVRNSKYHLQLHRYLMKAEEGEIVDHINHNPKDNRIENLRICTQVENMRNARRYKSNTSGRTGVYKCGKKWKAIITVNKIGEHLGVFDTFDEAVKARENAEAKYYREFTNNKK